MASEVLAPLEWILLAWGVAHAFGDNLIWFTDYFFPTRSGLWNEICMHDFARETHYPAEKIAGDIVN